MINFYFANFVKLVFAFVLALFQPAADIASAHAAMLNVGDEVDGMTLATGAAKARPLWVFCASEESNNVTTASCRVPQMEKLAIGHTFFATDSVFQKVEWSELEWELYIDDRPVNLNDFAAYNYVLPTMAPSPSLVREVFMKFTAWDIVLTNLQPGVHTIDGRVRADNEEYSWVVNLVIEDQSAKNKESSASRSGCSQSNERLSPFHNSCRLYGLRSGTIS